MEIPNHLTCFHDRQQDPVRGFCPVCGREIYNMTDDLCWDCLAAEEETDECD